MEVISNVKELKDNINTLEKYLSSPEIEHREYAIARIKNGTCFVAYQSNGMTKFAPSRFIGYKNNSLSKHESNFGKHGGITNPAISKLLRVKLPVFDEELEEQYKKYCIFLGYSPPKSGLFGVQRKYWKIY